MVPCMRDELAMRQPQLHIDLPSGVFEDAIAIRLRVGANARLFRGDLFLAAGA